MRRIEIIFAALLLAALSVPALGMSSASVKDDGYMDDGSKVDTAKEMKLFQNNTGYMIFDIKDLEKLGDYNQAYLLIYSQGNDLGSGWVDITGKQGEVPANEFDGLTETVFSFENRLNKKVLAVDVTKLTMLAQMNQNNSLAFRLSAGGEEIEQGGEVLFESKESGNPAKIVVV